jgi:hypothetical protein
VASTRKKFQSRQKRPFLFEIDGNDFETARRVPGATFVELIRLLPSLDSMGTKDMSVVGHLGDSIREVFEMVMEPEEFERFWKFARSPDGPDFETLFEVLGEMVADDTDRPTGRPSPSGRGPRRTGATSTDG